MVIYGRVLFAESFFMDYKQPHIAEELKRRIAAGVYAERIPASRMLAEEFGVNIKTVDKAVSQLVEQGLLERTKRSGTRIVPARRDLFPERMIEVIFEGFTTIFSHPFGGEIWEAMMHRLTAAGYRTILNMLESDPETGLLRLDHFSLCSSTGKIVLGIGEKHLLDRVAASRVPFITACDPVDDPLIPQVSFDFTDGIRDAVNWLSAQGCSRIAFIGQTRSYVNLQQMRKFNAYLKAVQQFRQVDPELIEDVRPLAGKGAPALDRLLRRTEPDALIAAYDHQLPEILGLLGERGLRIPVVGCDGLNLPGIPAGRHTVAAPRHECGEKIAERLIHAINTRRKPRSVIIPARFI